MDYLCLNDVTRKDLHPLLRINNALNHFAVSGWFSSLDLRSGHRSRWSWPQKQGPRRHSLSARSCGSSQSCLLGLCASATFRHLMERELTHVPRNPCFVYLDSLPTLAIASLNYTRTIVLPAKSFWLWLWWACTILDPTSTGNISCYGQIMPSSPGSSTSRSLKDRWPGGSKHYRARISESNTKRGGFTAMWTISPSVCANS